MGIAFTEIDEAALAAIDSTSTMQPRLSQPSTVIGIAPAPLTSHRPYDVDDLLLETDVVPANEPKPAAKPPDIRRKSRMPWIAAGLGALVVAASTIIFFVARRHHPDALADAGAVDAAIDVFDLTTPLGAPDATADVLVNTAPLDAGADGGRRKPKPPKSPRRH
jgi:hypothetical protein